MILLKLFFVFAKVGLLGFGGGLAMIPMIYQSSAEFGLIDSGEFANLVGISQITPGPLAVNAATYVGYNAQGVLGALAATVGEAVPAFVLITLVCYFLEKFKDSRAVQGAFKGIRPVTVGLIASAVVMMAKTVFTEISFTSAAIVPIIIAVASFVVIMKFKVNPIFIMIGGAACGAIFCS